MRPSLLSIVVIGLGMVALSGIGCADTTTETQSEAASGALTSEARTGQEIFASTCAACHGAGGEGVEDWMQRDEDGRLPPPPLNGEGHTWHHSDGVLYGIVSEGGLGLGSGSNMPGFKDVLTREEIIAVLEYVKTLWEGKEIDGIPILETQREFSETDPYPAVGG